MNGLKIAVIYVACLCFVFTTNGKKLGSRCKYTGTCEAQGTCPDDIIGKCCGGLDCCDCQKENATCGSEDNGTCVSEGTCTGSAIAGRCCEGFECCESQCQDINSTCGTAPNEGVCFPVGECSRGSVVEGSCCEGSECCHQCLGPGTKCAPSGEDGTCIMTGYCFQPTGDLGCCPGFVCCK